MRWVEALKLWNSNQPAWCIPRKGTPEHAEVKRIMAGEKVVRHADEERTKKAKAEVQRVIKEAEVVGKAKRTVSKEKLKSFMRKAVEKKRAKKAEEEFIVEEGPAVRFTKEQLREFARRRKLKKAETQTDGMPTKATVPMLKNYQKGEDRSLREELQRVVLQDYDSHDYPDVGLAYEYDDMKKWLDKQMSRPYIRDSEHFRTTVKRFLTDVIAYLERVKINRNGKYVVKDSDWEEVFH